jgi:hypothetical protein
VRVDVAANSIIEFHIRRKLRHLIRNQAEHDLQAWRKEISTRTSKLRDQISTFRQDQKRFMPKAGDKVSAQTSAGPAIEDEKLFLPSDLTELERQNIDVVALGIEESKWREGQVFDVLRALQHIVKALSSFRKRKLKHDRQQKQNSRAGDQITELTKRQSQHMETYNIARQAVISLNGSTQFPLLTEADLFMKSVQQKRHVGDSKRTDGLLFRATALATLGSYDQEDEAQMEDHVSDDGEGFEFFTFGVLKYSNIDSPCSKRNSNDQTEVWCANIPFSAFPVFKAYFFRSQDQRTGKKIGWANHRKARRVVMATG